MSQVGINVGSVEKKVSLQNSQIVKPSENRKIEISNLNSKINSQIYNLNNNHSESLKKLVTSFENKIETKLEVKKHVAKKRSIHISINKGPTPSFQQRNKNNLGIATFYKETSEKIKNKFYDLKSKENKNINAKTEKGFLGALHSVRITENVERPFSSGISLHNLNHQNSNLSNSKDSGLNVNYTSGNLISSTNLQNNKETNCYVNNNSNFQNGETQNLNKVNVSTNSNYNRYWSNYYNSNSSLNNVSNSQPKKEESVNLSYYPKNSVNETTHINSGKIQNTLSQRNYENNSNILENQNQNQMKNQISENIRQQLQSSKTNREIKKSISKNNYNNIISINLHPGFKQTNSKTNNINNNTMTNFNKNKTSHSLHSSALINALNLKNNKKIINSKNKPLLKSEIYISENNLTSGNYLSTKSNFGGQLQTHEINFTKENKEFKERRESKDLENIINAPNYMKQIEISKPKNGKTNSKLIGENTNNTISTINSNIKNMNKKQRSGSAIDNIKTEWEDRNYIHKLISRTRHSKKSSSQNPKVNILENKKESKLTKMKSMDNMYILSLNSTDPLLTQAYEYEEDNKKIDDSVKFKKCIKNNKSLSLIGIKDKYKELLENKIPAVYAKNKGIRTKSEFNNIGLKSINFEDNFKSVLKIYEKSENKDYLENKEIEKKKSKLSTSQNINKNLNNSQNDEIKKQNNERNNLHQSKNSINYNNYSKILLNKKKEINLQMLKMLIQDNCKKGKKISKDNNKLVNDVLTEADLQCENKETIIHNNQKEEDFDDINSIIKHIRFENINVNKENIFSENNFLYDNFEGKFNEVFTNVMMPEFLEKLTPQKSEKTNAKESGGTSSKKTACSSSTKKGNYCLSPSSREGEKINLFNVHLSKLSNLK